MTKILLRWLCAVLVVVAAVGLVAAQSGPVLGPDEALAFDYPDEDFVNSQVSGFQASWDGGGWSPIGPTAFRDASTTSGATSYKFIPPFSSGQHTVSVRACNATGCGGGSVPFPFTYATVPSVPSSAPSNVRKVPR